MAADPNDASARIAMGYAFGDRGDFVRAKAEFDEALRLAPHSSHVLIQNASWAASFGDPARGVELADQVVALDPHLEHWAASRLAYSYFAAGQDAKAVAVLDGVPPDVLAPDAMIVLPCSLAALGRVGEASHWLAEALKRNPRLTIESWINEGDYSNRVVPPHFRGRGAGNVDDLRGRDDIHVGHRLGFLSGELEGEEAVELGCLRGGR